MEEASGPAAAVQGGEVRWCAFEALARSFRVAATERGACRLSLPGEDAGEFFRWLARRFPRARLLEDPGAFAPLSSAVRAYLAGEARVLAVPLDPIGSPFQRAVWEEVRRIPFGTTVAYGEIARRLGAPQASRAVGAAVAANPLPILLPTHRVVGSDGSIPGYGPAVPIKVELLRLEGIAPRSRRRATPSGSPAGAEGVLP
ncbi:MAG TPA: methylated-DNA--[protein]-cysteine S-methyltransferase [Planctomycetota bacterium]|nr:methylated-DNA--[protein]-cysteine S-methyltransferase [Planctomycetota bacterium]